MIHLISLKGTTINLPYQPDMPLWQYLRDVIAPAAKFEVIEGKTVLARIIAKGQAFNFENKHRLLGEIVEDGGKLRFTLPLGPSWGTLQGNACPDGGDASGCPVCLEDDYDFSLDCLHRFHAHCLLQTRATQCPLCQIPFTDKDCGQLGYMQRLLRITGATNMRKRV